MVELTKLGRYQLRRVLGKGAMGVVYEGFDPSLNRHVAVKTILKSVAIDAETSASYSARFVREAQAVARLNHPHIVQVHDFGEQDEVAYIVMEFIEGRELRAFFDARENFGPAEAVRIMGELLDALDFAHERGVVHRDVKPANVMMDADRRVKLADFGVARIQDSNRSLAGTMVGTPAFMSPEQIKGGKIDGRTDIFSAGTILYQLLTGEQPFKGEGAWTVAKKIVEEDPPPPSSISISVSPALDAVVHKALAKNPAQRFAKAREFAAALRAALVDPVQLPAAVPARPQGNVETKASETELEFWRSIQNRDDLEELELYVEQFPNGAYTQLARLKIAKLRGPVEVARKATQEKDQQEAEMRARREADERAQRGAEEKTKRETQERARLAAAAKAKAEAEEKERREAVEMARRETAEKARREAEEKARRESEEKVRQAKALALLKQQEAAARARAAVDEDATVAIGGKPAALPPAAGRKPSYAFAAITAAIVIAGAIGAYLVLGRKPAPVPVAEAPVQALAPPSAAPLKLEITAADVEKIKKETEERIRREYADKSAAEQAVAAKAASEKAIQEKQLALRATADKAAIEKAAAEKVAAEKAQAEKLAAAKSVAERASLEKAAAEKAAAERAAAEKLAAEKAAAEKAAAEKAAAAKAAAAVKPGWPSVGDHWVYSVQEPNRPGSGYQVVAQVLTVTGSTVRDSIKPSNGPAVALTHQAGTRLVELAPNLISFSPYLRAFQEIRAGERLPVNEASMCIQGGTTFGLYCRFDARVAGRETVNVRAGSFNAWKIEIDFVYTIQMQGSQNRGGALLSFWYAEEAKRYVKYQFRHRAGTAIGPDVDMELVSYTPAGAK